MLAELNTLRIDVAELSDEQDLYDAGLKSLAALHLMLALEAEFGIEFPDSALHRSAFATVARIRALVDDVAPNDQVLVLAERDKTQLEQTGGWDTLGMRGTCSPPIRVSASILDDQVLPVAANTLPRLLATSWRLAAWPIQRASGSGSSGWRWPCWLLNRNTTVDVNW